MAARKKRHPLHLAVLKDLEVTGFAAEGKALARYQDQVIFIPFAAPGDRVDVRIRKVRKNYMEAELLKLHHKSAWRIEPSCQHFGVCGGCKWQHLAYEKQLAFKQQEVIEALRRIGKQNPDDFECLPVKPAPELFYYRNKLEFTFSNRRWLTSEDIQSGLELTDRNALGFHVPGLFDKVLNIETCMLQAEPSNRIRLAARDFAQKNELTFFDLRENTGLLRNLIIRNTPSGECMVVLVCSPGEEKARNALLRHLHELFPEISSLYYVENMKGNASLDGLSPVLFSGKPLITEHMDGLRFALGPKSFYQTNSRQAAVLYGVAREFAALQGHERVYDLYSGAGTIALYLASDCEKVTGIEYVEEAVEKARENARENEIFNARFVAGDMARVLNEHFMEKEGYPHVVITDPPRAGMHPGVTEQILKSGADRIVYVSCNPATQARDILALASRYRLIRVQPVDMFPQTHHIENVALLERK